MAVPDIRLSQLNQQPIRPDGDYVLYWMTASRRRSYNYGLQRAVEWSKELDRPLVILEALRLDYPWASPRLHAFIIQGMADNARALARSRALYYPFIETAPGQGRGFLAKLAERACLVVADEYPCFFIPRMLAAAAARLKVRLEAVDGNGLIPLRAAAKSYPTAYTWRRFVQQALPGLLTDLPRARPLQGARLRSRPALDQHILDRWPPATPTMLRAGPSFLGRLSLDQEVAPATIRGGERAGRARLNRFLDQGLERYLSHRLDPLAEATSGLSPYLHFGHLSPHEVLIALARRADWTPDRLLAPARGRREGWWDLAPPAEAWLDQLVTWRELGFNFCHHHPDDYDQYDTLPAWARATLKAHRADPRPYVYDQGQLAAAATHDPVWNAAQRQLVRDGVIHSYLRMVWGKKIVQWSASPRKALATMIDLNNRYALDGRDPNSYSGTSWCLGRFDRPFGPERPVFGKVRYMSSRNTARKMNLGPYLAVYGS